MAPNVRLGGSCLLLMSAALVHPTRAARCPLSEEESSTRSRVAGRLARLAVVAAVALPAPLFAALGLSLPLPAAVERLATELVPFAAAPVLEAASTNYVGAHGSIVLTPRERS